MKPSRRITLELKTKACTYCESADKAKLRQGRNNYCKDKDAKIKNGHCTGLVRKAKS